MLLLAEFLLIGCVNSPSVNRLTQRENLCREFKRSIIFNVADHNFKTISTSQKTNAIYLYDKYNCKQLEDDLIEGNKQE
jgi:hypothetical protein